MLEAAGDFGFGDKTSAAIGLIGEMGQYLFERDVAAQLGAGVVIAVKLPAQPPNHAPASQSRTPWLPEIIETTLSMMQGKIIASTAAAATIVIEPDLADVTGFGLRRFPEGRRFIDAGEAAAEAALPRLAAVLPWLGEERGAAAR